MCKSIYLFCSSGMVDTIFADVAQPDQARIVAINAHNFLKNGGHFVISIKVRNNYIKVPMKRNVLFFLTKEHTKLEDWRLPFLNILFSSRVTKL